MTVLYTSPTASGFSGELAYSVGEQAGSNSAGRQVGAALAYSNGPLNARLAYDVRNSDNTATVPPVNNSLGRNILIAANYDFQVAKAFVAFGKDKGASSSVLNNTTNAYGVGVFGGAPIASTDSNIGLIGATVPVGANGTVIASYIRKNDKTVFNQDAQQWAVGYSRALSKRTSAYASFAKITNKNDANYTVAKYPVGINCEMDVVLAGCDARRPSRRSASTARGGQRRSAPARAIDIHNLF